VGFVLLNAHAPILSEKELRRELHLPGGNGGALGIKDGALEGRGRLRGGSRSKHDDGGQENEGPHEE
jgi:hypothetical protein